MGPQIWGSAAVELLPRAGGLVDQGRGEHPVPVGARRATPRAGAAAALPVPPAEDVARHGRVVGAAGGPPADGPHGRKEAGLRLLIPKDLRHPAPRPGW